MIRKIERSNGREEKEFGNDENANLLRYAPVSIASTETRRRDVPDTS